MSIQEAYKRFLLKINKNDTDNEIRISTAEFVYMFNEMSLVWLGEKINGKAGTDSINDIQELLVEELELSNFNEAKGHNDFLLPEDFQHFSSAIALAERNGCEKELEVYNIKPKEKNTWLKDDMNNPSFDWEETISIISGDRIQVYKSDFDVTGLNLSYYRKPRVVDIEGYKHIDGKTLSTNIDPDLSNSNVNEIINRCALEVAVNYKNGETFQLDQQRILTEKK